MPRSWLKKIGQFTGRAGKRKKRGIHSPVRRYSRLEFEVLESRLAPTVTSTFTAATGLLSVISDAADTISLAVDAGSGDVLVNNSNMLTSGPAAATAVQQIRISGGTQNNIFDLSQLAGSPFPNATSFTVTGGGGNDTLIAPNNQPNTWTLTGQDQGSLDFLSVAMATPASGGMGYAGDEILTVLGGTGNSSAQLSVTSVDSSGGVTGVSVLNGGQYSTPPDNPAGVTGGGLSGGATFNLTFIAVPRITFSAVQNLTGGNQSDTFNYAGYGCFESGTISELPSGSINLEGSTISVPGTIRTNGGDLTVNDPSAVNTVGTVVTINGTVDTHGGNLTVYAETIGIGFPIGPATVSTRQLAAGADPATALSTGKSGDITFLGAVITLGDGANLFSQAKNGFVAGNITVTAVEEGGAASGNGLHFPLLPLQLSDSSASIELDAARVMGGVVTFEVIAENLHVSSDPGTNNPPTTLQTGIAFLENFDLIGTFAKSNSDAEIKLGAGSSIVADSFGARATATSDAEAAPTAIKFGIAIAYVDTTAKIEADGSISTTGDVSLQSFANNTVFAMATPGGNAGNGAVGAAVGCSIEYSVSSVNVGNSAVINVADGNLLVQANTTNNKALVVQTTTGQDGLLGIGFAISFTDDRTTAQLFGQATVAGDVTVQAYEVKNGITGDTFFGLVPMNYGGVSVVAGVGTDDTGNILSNEQSFLFSQLKNKLTNSWSSANEDLVNRIAGLSAAAAVAYDDEVNQCTATIGSSAIVTATGNVTVDAAVNDRLGVVAGSSVSVPPVSDSTPLNPSDFAGSVAVAIGQYSNTAIAFIDSGATVDAGRTLSVTSETLNDWQLPFLVNLYQSATAQATYKTSDAGANAQQVHFGDIVEVDDGYKGGGTLGSLINRLGVANHWYQYIGPGAPTLDLTIEDFSDAGRWHDLGSGWLYKTKGFIANLTTYLDDTLGVDNNLADSWSQATSTGDGTGRAPDYNLAGSLTNLTLKQTSHAFISQGALINQSATHTGQQNVFVLATGTSSSVNLGGSVQFPGLQGGTSHNLQISPQKPGAGVEANQGAVGVGVVVVSYTNKVSANIDTGVHLYADSLDVDAETAVGNISSVISGASSGNFGFIGVWSQVTVDDTTLAWIANGAQITIGNSNVVEPFGPQPLVPNLTTSAIKGNALPGIGGTDAAGNPTNTVAASVVVQSHDSSILVNLAGGITAASNFGIGASVAFDQIHRDTEAFIGDSSSTPGSNNGTLVLSSDGNVIIDAKNAGTIASLSLAGTAVSGHTGPDISQVKTAPSQQGQSGGQYGIGVSADVSYNQITDNTRAYIADVNITAPSLSVNANNSSLIVAASGSVAIVTSGQATSVGLAGSYAENDLAGGTNAFVANSSIGLSGNLVIDATSKEQIFALSASGSAAPNQGSVSLAGQVSVNSISTATHAEILSQSSVTDNNVTVTALDKGGIFTVAGALDYGGKVGIGAAVSLNSIPDSGSHDVTADVQDSDISAGGDVTVSAESQESIKAITAAAGIAQSGMAGALAMSLNTISENTQASVQRKKKQGVQSGGRLSLSAQDSSSIFVLAGAGSSGTISLGAAITSDTITENVQAQIEGTPISAAAVTNLAQGGANVLSFALSGGGGNGAAGGGSYSANTLNGSVVTDVRAAVVTAATSVDLEALDDNSILSLAGNVEQAQYLAVGVAVSKNDIASTVQAEFSTAQVNGQTVTLHANGGGQITSIAVAGGESSAIAAGGGQSHNQITPTIEADVVSSQVSAATMSLLAESTAEITSVAAGAGGAAGLTAFGADSSNTITGAVTAAISASVVDATTSLSVQAQDSETIFSVAGNGEKGAISLGGSTSKNTSSLSTTTAISDSQVTAGAVSLLAQSDATITSIAVGGADQGILIGGSKSNNSIAGSIAASIDTNATVLANSSLDLEAHEDATIFAGAGTVKVGGIDVGGSESTNNITPTVQAGITQAQSGASTVTVLAQTSAAISSIAVSGSVSKAPLGISEGGSESKNTIGGLIGATIGGGAVVNAGQTLTVETDDHATILSAAGSLQYGGLLSVGHAKSTNDISTNLNTEISSSRATAGFVTLRAQSDSQITAIAVGGNLGGDLQFSGSTSSNTINGTIAAKTDNNADVAASTSLDLEAHEDATILAVAGNGVGGHTGIAVGGAEAKNDISPMVLAEITGSQANSTAISLLAESSAAITAIAVSGAGGDSTVAAGGSESTNNIGESIESKIDSGAVAQADNTLSLKAEDKTTILSAAGSVQEASVLAVGGALSNNMISNTVVAEISGAQASAPIISILAKSDGSIEAVSVGGAAGKFIAADGGYASNTIGGTITASIDAGTTVTAGSSLDLEAHEDASITLLAGNGAGSIFAAFGLASASDTINPTVQAQISASQVSAGSISILAAKSAQINSLAIGAAGAKAITAGASFVDNEIGGTVDAHVSDGSAVSAVNAITISAQDVSSISALGGAAAGALGLDAAVAATTDGVHNTVTAYVDGSVINSTTGDITISATSKPNIISDALAGAGAAGASAAASVVLATIATTTDAHFSGGANIQAGGGITAQAQFAPSTKIVAGGIAFGFLSLGASDAEASLSSHTNASAQTGAVLSAGGAVTIGATSDAGSLTVDSYQGTLGGIVINGAFAQIDSANNASAFLTSGAAVNNAAAVNIIAETSSAPVAHSYGLSAGTFDLGATYAKATEKGTTKAFIEGAQIGGAPGQQVGSLAVMATTSTPVEAESWAAAGGLFAGSINFASATAEPNVQAYIGNQTGVLVSSTVTLNADTETVATTHVFGLSIGLHTAGLCESDATDAPEVSTYLGSGSSILAGGGVRLQSSHNLSGEAGAKAMAEAPAVAVAGYAGAKPTASANANVNSYVSPSATIQTNGDITIGANSNNSANAEADSLVGGILGGGTSIPTATVNATTVAHMNGAVIGAHNLIILAQSSNVGRTDGGAVSVGLINGAGVIATTNVSPAVQASIGDGSNAASVSVGGDVSVTSQSTDSATANANSVVGGIGIGLGIVNASANLSPAVTTFIGQNSSVATTGGSVTLQALHNYNADGTLISGKQAQTDAGASGGGAISVQNTTATSTANANVQTHVDAGAAINAAHDVVVQSLSENTAHGSANSLSGGVFFGAGGVVATSSANGTTKAYLSGIDGLTTGGNLTVLAQGTNSSTSFAQSAGGGVVSLDGSHASANDSPNVLAALSSRHLVSVGGTATIEGLALGNASADAEGESFGVASVGSSKASASWSPTIEANIGAGTNLQAGGDVKVLAFDNYDRSGNVDKTRQAYATAIATPFGAASIEAADIALHSNSNVNAHIGAGASITAAFNLEVDAQAFNQVAGAVYGGGIGFLISYGSTKADADMTSRTLAGTDDAFGAAPTVLRAGQEVQILSVASNVGNVTANGSGGGLIGLGGLQIDLFLISPFIQSRLGNNTTIDAGKAFVWIGALNQNHLTVNGSQSTFGAIVNNQADANASAYNSQTLADIGSNVQVNAAAFLLSAADTVESSATSDADVPGQITGNNTANSEADENTNVRVHIGSGSSITASVFIVISAAADQVITYSKAKTHTAGAAGNLYSFAGSNKNVNSEVDTDPGSSLTSANVTITAAPAADRRRHLYPRRGNQRPDADRPGCRRHQRSLFGDRGYFRQQRRIGLHRGHELCQRNYRRRPGGPTDRVRKCH